MKAWLPFSIVPFLLAGITGCSSTPADRYRNALEPLLGKSKRAEIDALYGAPRFCLKTADGETCEYAVAPKAESAANDILHVYYDPQGLATAWEPLYLPR